jgi:hypothetical protein
MLVVLEPARQKTFKSLGNHFSLGLMLGLGFELKNLNYKVKNKHCKWIKL